MKLPRNMLGKSTLSKAKGQTRLANRNMGYGNANQLAVNKRKNARAGIKGVTSRGRKAGGIDENMGNYYYPTTTKKRRMAKTDKRTTANINYSAKRKK